ncbi:PepSY domain-containing protein [Alcanivorax sp. IO_7]|nr:PepSY domain-containing protein [Alcanivorax sp. IO_7]
MPCNAHERRPWPPFWRAWWSPRPAGALDVDQDEALRLRQSGEVRSFEAILGVALERHPGARLLEAELEREDGELVYELELLTGDGVVREMDIDARSGEVIEDEVDD